MWSEHSVRQQPALFISTLDSQGNVSGEGDSQSTEELTTGGVHIDEKNNNVDHLGFYLQGAYTTHHKVAYGGYNYSTLKTVFLLQRKYSAYLMQVITQSLC